MKSDPRLKTLTQKYEALMKRVAELPPGGDLEGLIEEGLTELDQALYRELLAHRQQAASAGAEAFPPCGVPAVPKPDARRPA